MAFMITNKCSGKDSICEDICAFNCIKVIDSAAADGGRHFMIDEEQCTDCGACALACPELAIVHDDAYAGFHTPVYWQPTHGDSTAPGPEERAAHEEALARNFDAGKELPEGYLTLNGRIESWARLMASTSD